MLQLRNKTQGKGPLWLVEVKYSLGSDAACDIQVVSPGVQERHAEFHVDGDDIEMRDLVGSTLLKLNGQPAEQKVTLKAGDIVSLGDQEFEIIDPKVIRKPQPRPVSTKPEWSLKALNTALADKHFDLKGSQTLGRSQECDVSLGVVHLSRKHAKITVTDRGLKIEDLNSSNGTYVNGKKISQAIAHAGDEVSFDTLRFRIIGPVIDEDKTTMRPSSDGDMTTVRPALKIPEDVAGSAKAQSQSARRNTNRPRSQPQQAARTEPKPQRPQSQGAPEREAGPEDSNGGKGILLAVIAVILGAGAAAWFFLK